MKAQSEGQIRSNGMISTIAAAWILSLGFDFFLHAGLMARLYQEPSAFLLPPLVALRRVPAGYAAFLGLVAAQYWLFRRIEISGVRAGWRFGGSAGAVAWGALVLGLYSITTARPALLVGWWLGQSVELALSGAVIGAALSGMSLGRIWRRVGVIVFLLVAVTLVLQGMGWSPAARLG